MVVTRTGIVEVGQIAVVLWHAQSEVMKTLHQDKKNLNLTMVLFQASGLGVKQT